MSKATILVVEDEAIVAADLSGKLTRLGYEVVGTAGRGDEAVELTCRLHPQLVLMDISLDGPLDGITAAEAIHSQHDVPVVYLTAHSDSATLARAKRAGTFGYILKPFDERELSTQIELALYKHQAEEQLREHREWLRVTLTSIGDAVIATNAEGRIIFVNPVAESLTGWSAETASGQPVQDVFRIVNEQTCQPLEEPVTSVLREGRAVELANHAALLTRDGRTVPIEDSAAPIRDSVDRVIGAVLVFHDVTDKRQAEVQLRRSRDELATKVTERTAELAGTVEALRQEVRERQAAQEVLRVERQRFHSVLDMLPAYVVLLSPDYRVPFANRFFEERFGKSEGRRCYEYLFNRTEPCENCETYKVLKTNSPHRWEWSGPDGRHYDIHDFPFTDADGSPCIVEMGLDTTEVKRAQLALKELNETLERRVAERTEELRASENRYRNLFTSMSEGFAVHELIYDADGKPWDYRFLEVNPAFEQATGLKAADLLGRTLREVLPETEPVWLERFSQVVLTGKPDQFENYHHPTRRWYDVRASRTGPNQFAVIFFNVSDRK
ncbi:MAG: PAS domain-containing protein [Pirellulaceae bacterium]